jgi:hypothetical protein
MACAVTETIGMRRPVPRSRCRIFAYRGGTGVGIANYASSRADAKELRTGLHGEAFEVTIDPAPKLDPSVAPSLTAKQGQYLAFIHNYTKIHGQAPAESDLERYFRVSPPAIHDMIKTLERNGLIERTPGLARSIRVLVRPEHLPRLE